MKKFASLGSVDTSKSTLTDNIAKYLSGAQDGPGAQEPENGIVRTPNTFFYPASRRDDHSRAIPNTTPGAESDEGAPLLVWSLQNNN